MSTVPKGVIGVEEFVSFFEKLSGVQFIDAKTGRPLRELAREDSPKKNARKSDYELWLEQQPESVRLEHEMGAI